MMIRMSVGCAIVLLTAGITFGEIQKPASIRDVDFKKVIVEEQKLLEAELCEHRAGFAVIENLQYADLDGDSKEEAVVTASTCLQGTAGPDIARVYKLTRDGALHILPRDILVSVHEDVEIHFGNEPGLVLSVEKGILVGSFSIHNERDPNCCPMGGVRKIYWRWNGQRFAIRTIRHFPNMRR